MLDIQRPYPTPPPEGRGGQAAHLPPKFFNFLKFLIFKFRGPLYPLLFLRYSLREYFLKKGKNPKKPGNGPKIATKVSDDTEYHLGP